MYKTVEGIYNNGVISLLEPVIFEGTKKVIVTFIEPQDKEVDQLILAQFESLKEDWMAPGMEIYDKL